MHVLIIALALGASVLPGGDAYLKACEAQRHARYAEAIQSYEACASADEALAPYARIKAAFCQGAAGDRSGAAEAYQRVLKGEEGPWTRMARMYLAGLLALENQSDRAGAYYKEALAFSPQPWWVHAYAFKAAENAIASTTYRADGFAFFRDIVERVRFRGPRLEAARDLARADDPDDRVEAAFGLMKSGETEEAGKLLLAAPRAATGTEEVDWKAVAAAFAPPKKAPAPASAAAKGKKPIKGGKAVGAKKPAAAKAAKAEPVMPMETALATLRRVAAANPTNPWMRTWLAYLVRVQTSSNRNASAKAVCEIMLEAYPDAEETTDAYWWLAAAQEKDDAGAEAIAAYLDLARRFPKHYRADDALQAAAELQHTAGNTAAYVKTLQTLIKEQPTSVLLSSAWYELGLALTKTGQREEARNAFRQAANCGVPINGVAFGTISTNTQGGLGDYYAHRALARLADAGDAVAAKLPAVDIGGPKGFLRAGRAKCEATENLPDTIAKDARIRRLQFFGIHGLEEGEWEAAGLVALLKDDPAAGYYYQALGEAGFAATAMDYGGAFSWESSEGRPSDARLRVAFPRAYWPEIVKVAKEAGIDPFLILAVARQESTFRPALTSSAGACGVMQIMPGTAQWIAKQEPDIGTNDIDHLDIPYKSLRLGARYLKHMLDRCDNNMAYALAAYNAGPGNCDKWRARDGGDDLEAFIEAISFTETRGYVRAVLGNYAAYRSLYPASAD